MNPFENVDGEDVAKFYESREGSEMAEKHDYFRCKLIDNADYDYQITRDGDILTGPEIIKQLNSFEAELNKLKLAVREIVEYYSLRAKEMESSSNCITASDSVREILKTRQEESEFIERKLRILIGELG